MSGIERIERQLIQELENTNTSGVEMAGSDNKGLGGLGVIENRNDIC